MAIVSDSSQRYVVASLHDWNRDAFERLLTDEAGKWEFVSTREQLDSALEHPVKPRYVFFPHWSFKVPNRIIDEHECIAFHMTDVPYGRGGSPLQNLIVRGHTTTKLTALRMTDIFDAGPVYMKRSLELDGSALDIFRRAAALSMEMIREIASSSPEPVTQTGEPTIFARRTPDQSEIPEDLSNSQLYDFIRMLDAPGYPSAFRRAGDLKIEFTGAEMTDSGVRAEVEITREKSEK